jgi:hypothetical protein
VLLPVLIRHKSMARCRPTATMAFFLAALVALVLSNTTRLFLSGGYSGWKRLHRQASSINAVRMRRLPCLVMEPL